MLFWLAELAPEIAALNIFRYITFRTGGAVITALLFVFLFGPRVIRSLRVRQGKGQPIRKEGPERHLLQKQGTPTMGGLMILSGVTVSVLLWGNLQNPYVWVVLLLTLVYGAVGLYDDYLKVTRQSADGFRGRIKIVIETIAALIATSVIASVGEEPFSTSLAIPFFKDFMIPLGWWLFVPFGTFIIVGAGNAVNLTDGLDGLAIVPVMIAAATFGFVSYLVGNVLFADYLQVHFVLGTGELAGAQHEVDLQIVGEQHVTDEVGDEAEGGGGDHHRHDSQAVQAVGQVYRIAGTEDDEGAKGDEQPPAQRNHKVLEERNGQRRGEGFLADRGDDRSGDQCGDGLDDDLDAPAEAVRRLPGDLEVVVVEADRAVDQGQQQHHPDVRVLQIAPQQHGDRDAREDHEAAHGGCALLLQKMALGALFTDRLALALADAQRPDHPRAEQEHEQQGRDHRPAGAERDVTEDIEGRDLRR